MSVQTPHTQSSSDMQPHQWDNIEGRGIDKLAWTLWRKATQAHLHATLTPTTLSLSVTVGTEPKTLI